MRKDEDIEILDFEDDEPKAVEVTIKEAPKEKARIVADLDETSTYNVNDIKNEKERLKEEKRRLKELEKQAKIDKKEKAKQAKLEAKLAKKNKGKVEETTKEEVKEEVEVEEKKSKKKEKKVKVKKEISKTSRIIQNIFITLSLIFVLGCMGFYGYRFVYWYKIYNPKAENGEKIVLLSNHILDNEKIVKEGIGFYDTGNNYVFKGMVDNNYVVFNNMLWRIVKQNSDGSMVVILDKSINLLQWDHSEYNYADSDINNYLNNYFYNLLNKDLLGPTTVCVDKVYSLSSLSCDAKTTENYVSLMDITTFLNSFSDGESYIVKDEEEIFWLSNSGNEFSWHTNGKNVSNSEAGSFYDVRPIVTLKSTVPYISGDGTIDNPYIIEKENNSIKLGSIINLDDDLWYVIEVKSKSYKLARVNSLKTQKTFSTEGAEFNPLTEGTLAYYLNNDYYDSLAYKKIIVESEFNVGKFSESYKDLENKNIKCKVGLLDLKDIKLGEEVDYFLSTTTEKEVMVYGNILKLSKPTMSRGVRPVIEITNDIDVKGKGTMDNPFIVRD